MPVSWIQVSNIRVLKTQRVRLHDRLNLIHGDNGSGKSTFLEAIRVLSRGPETATRNSELLGAEIQTWKVKAGIVNAGTAEDEVSVEWSTAGLELQLNQTHVRRTDLARAFAVATITPQSHRLLEDGPTLRRRQLDWGVFHVEQGFEDAWRRMSRALRQRNSALKQRQTDQQIQAWDGELAQAAWEMNDYRLRYVNRLNAALDESEADVLEDIPWTLKLLPGWPPNQDYADILRSQLARDRQLGYTASGPHRAQLTMAISEKSGPPKLSRGQQKLLLTALVLAQCSVYEAVHGRAPTLLIDDYGAELSQRSQRRLAERLSTYRGQLIVTAVDAETFKHFQPNHAMFHMEHGQVHLQ